MCWAHMPSSIQARERWALEAAEDRIRRANLAKRKLLLIPILDMAQKAIKKIQNDQRKLGVTIILNILRNAIREE